jgi:hypothetical protein
MSRREFTGCAVLCVVLFAAGCGPPTIDGSSDESLKTSIENVKAALGDEEKKKFEAAVVAITFDELKGAFADAVSGKADPEAAGRKLRDRLHGKTAAEIIAEGEKVGAEIKSAFPQDPLPGGTK